MDSKTRIEGLKDQLKKAEQAKTVAETQQAAALEQQKELEQQLAAENVTAQTISAEIDKLSAEIAEGIAEVEKLLPVV